MSLLVLIGATGCAAGRTGTDPGSPAPISTHGSTIRSTPVAAPGAQALAVLATLPVQGRAPLTGYARSRFGPAWTDDNDDAGGHNGCDTRNDVLARDLAADVLEPGTRGCVVLRGSLLDPYTGMTLTFVRGAGTSSRIQIDHVVALADAWQTGAQQLSERRRRDLANDPLELLAVSGSTNESKGSGDAATWLPPNRSYRCAYVARQIAIKRAYGLWVTPAEGDAMRRVLDRCPTEAIPTR